MIKPFARPALIATLATPLLFFTPDTLAQSFSPVNERTLPKAPALLTLDNELSDLPDGPMFINLWATWCKPCIDELPALNALKARYSDADIHWVALNYGDSLDQVRQFMANTPIELTVLLDATTQFSRQFPMTGLPTTFLVDRNGQVRYQLEGYADWSDPALNQQWEALLTELLDHQ